MFPVNFNCIYILFPFFIINLILVSGVVEKEEIKGNMGLYQIIERRTSNHGNGNQRMKCINDDNSLYLNFFSPTCPKAKFRKIFYLFKQILS